MPINLKTSDIFVDRHIGPSEDEVGRMLQALNSEFLDEFIDSVVPATIRTAAPLRLDDGVSEAELLPRLRDLMSRNQTLRSYIGMGYHDTITPPVIQRNILENPGWYTQYTPYQAEIAQGRLEALLNFQTMVCDLTGFPLANASLLDEATAAAEAMAMFYGVKKRPGNAAFFISSDCHSQTISVVETRAEPLGIEVIVGDFREFDFSTPVFGALLQYPASDGAVYDYSAFCEKAHENGALVAVAADILSLALLTPPGEFGADAAVGNTQRFGVPLGYGGPHAAFFATSEKYKRLIPGRIIGLSLDVGGEPALRMALQTREQHIKRERATSNICTAQVLLAVMAGMYAVYHGPKGVRRIAERVHGATKVLAAALDELGHKIHHDDYFDAIRVTPHDASAEDVLKTALQADVNLRDFGDGSLGISLDETVGVDDLNDLIAVFSKGQAASARAADFAANLESGYAGKMQRTSDYLQHEVFNTHHSETSMLRYMRSLEEKDLSLNSSMIPLGSCTMKLNATTEMSALTWPEVGKIHPFAPTEQTAGYQQLFRELEQWLAEMTGFDAVSLQPNAGAQGEYAGLLVIRAYHEANGDEKRNVCLIPSSAHGTNPASAVMAGMKVVIVKCDEGGNIDVEDLRAKAEAHREDLAAFMVTYPSTHGVFEESIKEICGIIHDNGGQVYMDGANMNAQVGLCRPAELGADVCHLNLHKTYAIPHGGGGPGMGPIGVVAHLKPHLPAHPIIQTGGDGSVDAISAAPWGSASILTISWAYIALLGKHGLTQSTKVAILNANYMAEKLKAHYPILYTGQNSRVAHEFILDFRQFKTSAGVEVEDVAKRLMDYGFHAPTVSFPVPGTLMIEPTESENLEELDRFCEALIGIRREIAEIENGEADRADNVLKNAPHTAATVIADDWAHAYHREKAAYPAAWVRTRKFWPSVSRINNAYGDRNLICSCPPTDAYESND